MNSQLKRIDVIRQKLIDTLTPTSLEIIDEGQKHQGHAGAQSGHGHFALTISAPAFIGKTPVQCHRMIYAALGELMQTDIHALRIRIEESGTGI